MPRILVIADIHGNLNDLLYLTGWSEENDDLYPYYMREYFDTVLLLGDYIGDNPRYCSVGDGDTVCGFIERKLSALKDAVIIKGNHEQNEIDTGIQVHRSYTEFLVHLSAEKLYEFHGIRLFCRHGFGKHLSDSEVCEMAGNDHHVNQADVVCFGHDHKARIFTDGKRVFMNPGSLMKREKERPCYGIIDTEKRMCELKQIDIEGRLAVMLSFTYMDLNSN